MKRVLICVALAGVYLWSCAIEFEVAVFSFHRHPDFPRTAFLSGNLGVLEPTYARSYLVVAYRHMSGAGFNAAEREQVRSYWDDRVTGDWDHLDIDWERRWETERARFLGVKPPPAPVRERYDSGLHEWALNCADDAFRTAIATGQDRRRRYGARSAVFREWVAAQDVVFSNCTETEPVIPGPIASGSPALARADREYQIAAAHFYTNHAWEAEAGFRRIAADASSPWHGLAPYLVARTLARAKDPRTEAELRSILSNPRLAPVHGISANLLRRVRQNTDPVNEIPELGRALTRRNAGDSLRQDLWDYTKLIDRVLDEAPWDHTPGHDAKPLPRGDDLTDWIAAFQGHESVRAIDRWRKTRSIPWLVAALSKVRARESAARELIDASAAVASDSPAFLTVAYHRSRLHIDLGEKSQARDEVDAVLASLKLPESARNHFQSLRMFTGGDLADFLRFAQRTPVIITTVMDESELPGYQGGFETPRAQFKLPRFDRDSIKILNERTPLRVWRQAISSDVLPPHLMQEFTLAAFARAILLADDEAAQEIEPVVGRVFPPAQKFLGMWSTDRSPEERRFTGVFALLHMASVKPWVSSGVGWLKPSHHMDSYRNNWWCSPGSKFEIDWDLGTPQREYVLSKRADPDEAARRASFLTDADRADGKREMDRLSATPAAPSFLGTQVLEWAASHPDDARVPEALGLVVRTVKYGCKDATAVNIGRKAFVLLHKQYPKSEWARKTPFRYD